MTNDEMLQRISRALGYLDQAHSISRRNKAAADLITKATIECSVLEIGVRQGRPRPKKAKAPAQLQAV